MLTKNPRNFNCKDEELPIIATLAQKNLERDLADFAAYSPKFDTAFLASFQSQIDLVQELVSPKAETARIKLITQRIYATMAQLLDLSNKLEGYIGMAGQAIPISLNDFEITDLKVGLRKRDLEMVVNRLKNVLTNIRQYEQTLREQGLNDAFIAQLEQANTQLKADKSEQYQTMNHRRKMVENNHSELNKLYEQLKLIMKVGQILYKKSDPIKNDGYLFSILHRQVNNNSGLRESEPEKLVKSLA